MQSIYTLHNSPLWLKPIWAFHGTLHACAGVVVAAKMLDDRVYSNAYYARVGGVSTQEMNRMEKSFIHLLEFRLMVTVPNLETYCKGIQNAYVQPSERHLLGPRDGVEDDDVPCAD